MPARNTVHTDTTFSPVHQPWAPQCTAPQTDRWTDGQTTGLSDYAYSWSYYAAVRSAIKNEVNTERNTALMIGAKLRPTENDAMTHNCAVCQ